MNNEKPHYPKGQSPAQIAHRLKLSKIIGKRAVLRKQKAASKARSYRARLKELTFDGEHKPSALLNGQNYRDSVARRVASGSFSDTTSTTP